MRFPLSERAAERVVGLAFAPDELVALSGDGASARVPLPEKFLTPSPESPNLASTADAAHFVQSALHALAPRSFKRAVLALPDRSTHMRLVEGPRSLRQARLRARLLDDLAPGADGRYRCDWIATRGPGRRALLGAAIRSSVARQYEGAVEACGVAVRWVDACSLALVPEWLAAGSGVRALVLLDRRHFVLVGARDACVESFRFKLRSAGDPAPAATAVRQSIPPDASILVRGEGAESVAAALDATASADPIPELALSALLRRKAT